MGHSAVEEGPQISLWKVDSLPHQTVNDLPFPAADAPAGDACEEPVVSSSAPDHERSSTISVTGITATRHVASAQEDIGNQLGGTRHPGVHHSRD